MEKGAVLFYVGHLHLTQKKLLVDDERKSLLQRIFRSNEEITYTGNDPLFPIIIETVKELKEVGITISDLEEIRSDLVEILNLDPVALEKELEAQFSSLIMRLTEYAYRNHQMKIMGTSDFFVDLEKKYDLLIDLIWQDSLPNYDKDLEEIIGILSKLKSTGRKPADCKKILHKTVMKSGLGTLKKLMCM